MDYTSRIRDWLSRVDKDAKEARNKRIFDLWLACWTQQEIADAVGITKQAVDLVCQEMANLPKLDKLDQSSADHATDFQTPTNGSLIFGWRASAEQ